MLFRSYQPTVQAAVPFIVPRDGIVRATAIVSQISALSGLVGPVLGGLLFGLFGIEPFTFGMTVLFTVLAIGVTGLFHVLFGIFDAWHAKRLANMV